MKKLLFIFVIVFFSFTTKGKTQQPPVTDTLAYLQSIVSNKSNFIGQPFSRLMDSLQIQIKFFSPNATIHYNKNKETSTAFSFYFPATSNDFYLIYPCLEIYWQSYVDINPSNTLYSSNNGGGWSAAVAAHYANAIIADIRVVQ